MTRNGITVAVLGIVGAAMWLLLGVHWARWVPAATIGLLLPGARLRLLPVAAYSFTLSVASGSAVHRGDRLRLLAEARASSRWTVRWLLIDATIADERVRCLLNGATTASQSMPAVVARRRGDLPCAVLGVIARDLFGLWQRRLSPADHAPLTVRVLPCALPFDGHGLANQIDESGLMTAVPTRDGDVFAALREYVPGDDPRLIHWAATAAATDDTVLVRQAVRTLTPSLRVWLDTTIGPADGYAEAFEVAVDTAYSLAIAAVSGIVVRTAAKTAVGLDAATDLLVAVQPAPETAGSMALPATTVSGGESAEVVLLCRDPALVHDGPTSAMVIVVVPADVPLAAGCIDGAVVRTLDEARAAWDSLSAGGSS